ncbi:hypothetical protein WH96_10290 [Kiloniella spongiae]|uniref:Uncharacterized protein n=1 Tax=Kiloniella spongiae TaxID=1489064 RepID=A0A0H2ME52_9PROT|nr:hypothetical protein [Kiloniella spongiae]KLN60844.1 hypothetical protein WH96_10290 [Kiloniella spongiae]
MPQIAPQSFKYPLFDIYLDYLKTVFGLTIGLGGLIYGLNNTFSQICFGAILVIFIVFGFHSFRRHRTHVNLDSEQVEITDFRKRKVQFKDIENIELRYYGRPVKDKDSDQKPKGVLHLTLKSREQKLTFDSNLYGFRYLVWSVILFAKESNLPLDPGTIGNMLDIGLDPEGSSEMPDPKMSGI